MCLCIYSPVSYITALGECIIMFSKTETTTTTRTTPTMDMERQREGQWYFFVQKEIRENDFYIFFCLRIFLFFDKTFIWTKDANLWLDFFFFNKKGYFIAISSKLFNSIQLLYSSFIHIYRACSSNFSLNQTMKRHSIAKYQNQ